MNNSTKRKRKLESSYDNEEEIQTVRDSEIIKTKDLKQATDTGEQSEVSLKFIFHSTQQDELSSPFCIQSANDFVVFKTKSKMGILQLNNQPEFHQAKFQLSLQRFESSKYNVIETLNVKESQVFKSMSHSQRNDVMLNTFLFPKCLSKNIVLVTKCQVSPNTRRLPPLTACLTSFGSIQISSYKQARDNNESVLESIMELCEIRKKSFSVNTIHKLEKLQEAADNLMFYDFDWCPEIVSSKRLLTTLTRSRDVIFYSVNTENEVVEMFSKKLDKSVNLIKWIKIKGDFFLIVDGVKGSLVQYSMAMDDEGSITSLNKVKEWSGHIKIPISHLEVTDGEFPVIVAAKSHSVEVFDGSSSVSKYVGLSVTGITSASKTSPAFLISTLDNEIHYLELLKSAGNLEISKFFHVQMANSLIPQDKFSCYGIATSKNKVLVYTALYPNAAHDHLSLKQPLQITVNQSFLNEPNKILVDNQSHRLTDYQDCVEAVRYLGSCTLETLASLTTMDYNIGLTDEFAYYLKIQLLVTNAKLIFYKMRSETLFEMTNETNLQIKKIIDAIHAFKIIKNFKSKKNPSKSSLLSIRCLANSLAEYINEDIQKPPYNQAQQALKGELETVLNSVKAISCIKELDQELCYYCEAAIDSDKLKCNENHQVSRCPVTKVQLDASTMNSCPRCFYNVTESEKVCEILEDPLCIYCDAYLLFA